MGSVNKIDLSFWLFVYTISFFGGGGRWEDLI